MAIRFDASTDYLRRTANIPTREGPWTWMAWVYMVATGGSGNYGTLVAINGNTSSHYDGLYFYYNGSNTRMLVAVDNGSYVETIGGTNLSTGAWYHVTLARSSSSAIVAYLNGVSEVTNTTSQTGGAFTQIDSGVHPQYSSDAFNGRLDCIKIFDAALTVTEILQEMHTKRPQRFANLNIWSPTFPGSGERARDYSGNGRNWTEGGTLTDEDPPPVSWGARSILVPYAAAAPPSVTGMMTPNRGIW